MSPFFLTYFRIILVFWQFSYVPNCGYLWVYATGNSVVFLNVWIKVFHKLWKILSHYFFKYSFCPFFVFSFLDSIMCMLVWLMVTHQSLRLCLFSFILFFFSILRVDNFNRCSCFPNLSLACSNLLYPVLVC